MELFWAFRCDTGTFTKLRSNNVINSVQFFALSSYHIIWIQCDNKFVLIDILLSKLSMSLTMTMNLTMAAWEMPWNHRHINLCRFPPCHYNRTILANVITTFSAAPC